MLMKALVFSSAPAYRGSGNTRGSSFCWSQPAEAHRVLEQDVVQSHAFAQEEVERYTYRMPGQANSYFYGFTRLIDLRKETEATLGPQFNQKRFHDFILAQGLLPPDLMREAVKFVAAEDPRKP